MAADALRIYIESNVDNLVIFLFVLYIYVLYLFSFFFKRKISEVSSLSYESETVDAPVRVFEISPIP